MEVNKTESKVKDGNYISIQSFMVKDLGLKGNELIIYALIYGFSQDGENEFNGSLQYICDWTNSSKSGVRKVLKSLHEKDLIKKTDIKINGVKFCKYKCNLCYKVNGGIAQSDTGGIAQSDTNTIDINNISNTIVGEAKFFPPTQEEVKNYCKERNNKVDTERFIDFYQSKGWYVGKNKMKDWKAAIRNWERESKPDSNNSRELR